MALSCAGLVLYTARARKSAGLALLREDPLENVPLQSLQLYVEAHHAMCGSEHTHTHVPLQVAHQ